MFSLQYLKICLYTSVTFSTVLHYTTVFFYQEIEKENWKVYGKVSMPSGNVTYAFENGYPLQYNFNTMIFLKQNIFLSFGSGGWGGGR